MPSITSNIVLFLFSVAFLAATSVNGASLVPDKQLMVHDSNTAPECKCKAMNTAGKMVQITFTADQVQAAFDKGLKLQKDRPANSRWPTDMTYRTSLNFKNSCKPAMGFPLTKSGDPNEPGSEWVIWDANGNYCGCATAENIRVGLQSCE